MSKRSFARNRVSTQALKEGQRDNKGHTSALEQFAGHSKKTPKLCTRPRPEALPPKQKTINHIL